MMLNFRQNPFPYRRQSRFKTGLGNTTPRYNSQVNAQRKKYFISSMKNSQDTPEWMTRTNKYSLRENKLHVRNNSMYMNPQSGFMQTKQKWIYESNPKSNNISGQFQTIRSKRARTKWEMKGHTFDFQWPINKGNSTISKQTMELKEVRSQNFSQSKTKTNSFFQIDLPKYGLKQSPLHRQKQTPIKIGHSALINTVYVK